MADLIESIEKKSRVVKLLARSNDQDSVQTALQFQKMIIADVVSLARQDAFDNNQRDLNLLNALDINELYQLEKSRFGKSFAIAC